MALPFGPFTFLLTVFAVAPNADENILSPDEGLPIIHWKDAANHLDQEVIVQGKIVNTGKSRSLTFLNFDQDRSFTAIVRKPCEANFPKPVQYLYRRKVIRLRGVISEFRGKPQIELCHPDQVRVLEKDEAIPSAPLGKTRDFNGVLTLATYNTYNFFDTHDDPFRLDETTRPKSREQLERLARTIREVDADVIALQEVENRGYLERFVRALLPEMGYEHVVCFEGNDKRGIDCALLSRFSVGAVTSYRHLRFSDGSGRMMRFRRDLLRVRIEPPGVAPFDVFVVHLKSRTGGSGTERIRLAELREVRRIIDELLASDGNARFAVCGDFNDTWDSNPIQAIRGSGVGELKCFMPDLPKGAVTYNREPHRSVIDFILSSPALARCYVPKSYRVLDGSFGDSGSDHNPVLIRLDLNRGAGAN